MANLQKNPLVIYHKHCSDGMAAAWCFWKISRKHKQMDFYGGVYQEELPDVDDRVVYLVDFSYKRAMMEEICDRAYSVILLDHHISAMRDLTDLQHPKFKDYSDASKSGAMLAWNYTHGDKPPPPAILYIQDRDLWQHVLPDTKEICMAIYATPFSFEEYDSLMLRSVNTLKRDGIVLLKKYNRDLESILNLGRRIICIHGYDVPAVNAPHLFASDIGDILCEHAPFAVTYYDTHDHRVFSLRSRPSGLDVSLIAAQYGGGGHKHASGFKVPRDHLLAMA